MNAPDMVERFAALLFAGVGLLLAAGLNVLMPRASAVRRVVVSLLAAAGVVAGAWIWSESPRVVGLVGGAMGLGVLVCLMLGSPRTGRVVGASARLFCRPLVCWGALGAAGLATTVASTIAHTAEDQAAIACNTDDLQLMVGRAPTNSAPVRAVTDRGTIVPLLEVDAARPATQIDLIEDRLIAGGSLRDHLIRRQHGDDRTNCHGWVFTAGRYLVGSNWVEQILQDNGYESVNDPRPGDLVIYREGGAITHTALVRYVTEGQPVLVEGKWGCAGVYLHPLDKTPYGTDIQFYRSPRQGHLLAIPGSADPRVDHPATE